MKLTLDPPGFAGAVGSVPLSVRIRERLMSAGHRFHANDNIAAYLRDGELDLLQAEVEERLQAVLRARAPSQSACPPISLSANIYVTCAGKARRQRMRSYENKMLLSPQESRGPRLLCPTRQGGAGRSWAEKMQDPDLFRAEPHVQLRPKEIRGPGRSLQKGRLQLGSAAEKVKAPKQASQHIQNLNIVSFYKHIFVYNHKKYFYSYKLSYLLQYIYLL